MSLTTIRYGRYTSGAPEGDTGNISAGDSRACVFDALTENVWFTLAGFVGGKVSSNVSARISVYDTDSSKNPRTRQGYFSPISVTTVMVGGGDGTHYTAAVSGSDNGPTNDAILGYSGTRYAVDILSGTNDMRHSMAASADISADNEQFYNRTAPSNPPPSSYGAYSSSVEGHLTAYLQGYQNEAPLAPSNTLYPTGTITETAPVFTADFDDLNGAYGAAHSGADTGDRLNQYKIQLRAVGTSSLLWNQTYDAATAEWSGDAVSRAYGGSVLTRGTQYEWRIRMSDEFGAWSDYSDWTTFTPVSLGFVTLDDDPTGKILTINPDFNGRWNHQSAADMTRVQVRLLSASGTVLQTGTDYNIADVTSTALPGHLFTVTWANTGFTDLAWGTSYQYQIRGKDATTWSDWSAARTFSTNAAPTVPSLRNPSNGGVITAYPSLSASFSDSDDDYTGDLTGVFRITRPDTTTVDCTPTYDSLNDRWRYQTTIAEISAYGVYSWKATGYDGTLYSGESATLGAATWSSARTFDYEAGPVLTIDSPADGDTVTTASLLVSWTVASGGPQVKYRVYVYADGDSSTTIYDSGSKTSTAVTHTIPSGYLRNNTSYDVLVTVTNGTPLTGASDIANIDVAFTEPDPVANFQVLTVPIGLDPFDTAVRLSWDQTAYASPEFQEYTIYRSAATGPDAGEVILARLPTPGEVAFVDYTPASGVDYTYSISVTVLTGVDSLESDRSSDTATVTLLGTVLSLVGNGGTYRACLLNVTDRSYDRQIQEAVYQSPASTKPVTVRSLVRYWIGTYAGKLISDTAATFQQRWDELDTLDAQQSVICVRDGWGRKQFGYLRDLKVVDQKPDYYDVSFVVREERVTEGTT